MEEKTIYPFQGTNCWTRTFDETKTGDHDSPFCWIPHEILLTIFDLLTYQQQAVGGLVCKKWACLMPVTQLFSEEPAQLPFPFVKEFLEKKHGKANDNKGFSKEVKVHFNEVVHSPLECYQALGRTLKNFEIKFLIRNNCDYFSEHLHGTLLYALLEKSAFSKGLLQKNEVFKLVFACDAGTTLFSNEERVLPVFCSFLHDYQEYLSLIDLRSYDPEKQLSQKGLYSLLLTLKDLKKVKVLDLQGIRIDKESCEILIQILHDNKELNYVHFSESFLPEDCNQLIFESKPERKDLNIKVHPIDHRRFVFRG